MSDIKLRDYQNDAKNRILTNIKNGVQKQLLEMPTSSGKTYMAASTISDIIAEGKKVFFIVADAPLVFQTYKAFKNIGLYPSILKAGSNRYFNEYADIQIVMAQTYKARMDKIPDLHADVVFCDEAHYMHDSNTMNKILERHPDAFIVGITGTPINEKGYLLSGYDKYELDIINIRELQRQKMVAIDRYFPATPMDVSNVRIKNTGEFNDKDLDETCNQSYITKDIVQGYLKFNEGHKAICFAINIDHAEKLRDEFLNAGIKAGVVHSKQKKFLNNYWFESHRKGRVQILVSVSSIIRGYDDVSIIDMIDCSPTNSLRKQIQKWGRCCRMDNLGIGYARIFDFGGNYNRFLAWSMPRMYSLDKAFEVRPEDKSIVCFNCFEPIYERTNKCPNCGVILTEQMEKKEREIKDNLRVQEIKEIQALTGSAGAIESLSRLLGYNGNTFYYTKILPVRVASVDLDVFNSEVIRLANYCRRKAYKPYYVVAKMREKMLQLGA